MNTANSESDVNIYLPEGQNDYISYDRIYNEVLDKVKKGLEKQRSNSSILKKKSKKQHSGNSKNDENIHPEDIALFQDDDSDDSDSDDFLEWENSDNETTNDSKLGGGLTRAKSHINDINDYDNNNKYLDDNDPDIVKDRIVLNKHFQKIYGFNDESFRHGNYEIYNNHDENDSDNESISDNNNNENNIKEEEQTHITENITEKSSDNTILENNENMNISTDSNDDLERQFYNELRRASMIIDLQQHYRLRDGLKNKEDLKKEIIEGYNSLHKKNYSYEDLPDFQNLDNLNKEIVEAKVVDNTNIGQENSNMKIQKDTNQSNTEEQDNNENNQLINDTWKFLFNNQYSLQFLSKSLQSSNNKSSSNTEDNTPITESVLTEKSTEEETKNTETEEPTSDYSNLELNNSIMTNILQHNIKNKEKLMKDREEEEILRKNKENDWLSFVQKELASMNLSSTSSQSKKEMNKTKKDEYSKFIPNKIPTAPKFEITIQQDETTEK